MRTIKGIVTSSKLDKTAIIIVHRYKMHPKYKKKFRVSKKFYAHDEKNICKKGDTVVLEETKPFSKLKRWKVKEKISSSDLYKD